MLNSEKASGKRNVFTRWLGAGFLFCFIVVVFILHIKFDIWRYLAKENISTTVSTIRAWAAHLGLWGPLIYALVGSIAVLITIPAALVIHIAVILFGYIRGGIASTLSLLIGITLVYFTAQVLGRPFILGFFGTKMARIEERFLRRELMNVVYLRLLFFMSPWMNWLLCVTGVRYRSVVLGTLLGASHNIILNVWLGGLMVDLIKSGRSLNPIQTPIILLPVLIGLSIFIVVRIVDSIYLKHRNANSI